MTIRTVILAAGQGKRMHSNLPKVLHPLAHKPLLEHVICTALSISAQTPPIIVYGHQGEQLKQHLSHYHTNWIEQEELLGTGHAVLQALKVINEDDRVLILYGDVPLITSATLRQFINQTKDNAIGLLTAEVKEAKGYGRIKRNSQQKIIQIIEETDVTLAERSITEINTGIYFVPAKYLKKWLPILKLHPVRNEYFLTDIISLAVQENILIQSMQADNAYEVMGVNDRLQLAEAERFYQRRYAQQLLRQGVGMADPNRIDIRGEVEIGRDVFIDINVILEGRVVLGDQCRIGPHSILRNTTLGKDVEVKANSIIDGAEIASRSVVGPFARIRPGTVLAEEVHIGNFVEIKNSHINTKTKVNHLSYLGDSEVGKEVNIGAGTITCNYDGINKHKTIIGDRVQVGSDSTLVAPITIADDAYVASATTVRKNVPKGSLVFNTREEQVRADWTLKRREKENSKERE